MDKVKNVFKKKPRLRYIAAAFFLLGAISLVAIRFATQKNNSVHYHANFALYVNGQKDEFKSFTFYEEVQACSSDDENNVKAKTHMHDQNSALIHVHASGMTWGQFFANLGYGLSNKAITTDSGVYVDQRDNKQLSFMLNGQPAKNIANEVIRSEDVLLINYGKDNVETLKKRSDSIPRTAAEANTKNDPATCSGSQDPSFTSRLKAALGINQTLSSH